MATSSDAGSVIADAVADRVKVLRRERRWSADQLADLLTEAGLPTKRSALANLEAKRRRDITVTELFAFAAVFGVPPALILGEPLSQLTIPKLPSPVAEPDESVSVAELVDWIAGVALPVALLGSQDAEFEQRARPLGAHRRHAALLERLILDFAQRNHEVPDPDDLHVQELARHRLHMRDMGAALAQLSLWAPPEINELLADPVAVAEKQLGAEYERTSSPTLESAR